MTYPTTLRLTADGVEIVVQRPTAQAVATAARAAVGWLTIGDAVELYGSNWVMDGDTLVVAALAEWIGCALTLPEKTIKAAREIAGRKGVARG